MKDWTLYPLHVFMELRDRAEPVLNAGEPLSDFVRESMRLNIDRRKAQREFIARGLALDKAGLESCDYVSATEMLARLDAILAATSDLPKKRSRD